MRWMKFVKYFTKYLRAKKGFANICPGRKQECLSKQPVSFGKLMAKTFASE